MKLRVASLLVVLTGSVAAQYIFKPFKGERPLINLTTMKDQDALLHKGEFCGDYFRYQIISDQHTLTWKVHVTDQEYRTGVISLVRGDTSMTVVQLDDNKLRPTAEFVRSDKGPGLPNMILIRISHRDYDAAPCLPVPQAQAD
jgi:hypothetical protein